MNEKEKRYHHLYMDVATRVAEMSYATRRKVGCVIVKDGNIISMGWNGMPAGMDNSCEYMDEGVGEMVTRPEVSHAEENAIAKLAKSGVSSDRATAYVTLEPCIHCAKLLFNAGIRTVVMHELYKNHAGTAYLHERQVRILII